MTETEFDAKLRAAIDWVVITAAVAIGIIYVLLGGILFRWWEIPPGGWAWRSDSRSAGISRCGGAAGRPKKRKMMKTMRRSD